MTIKPFASDLFGEVPVSELEVLEWVERTAPHIAHSRWRVEYYIRDWNVCDKIKREKIAVYGLLPSTPGKKHAKNRFNGHVAS